MTDHQLTTGNKGTTNTTEGDKTGATDAQHINIKVKTQDGTEIFFKIKRSQ